MEGEKVSTPTKSTESSTMGVPTMQRRVSMMRGMGGLSDVSMRRRSTLRNAVSSINTMLGLRRKTMIRRESKPRIKMENTYQLEPEAESLFKRHKVKSLIEDLMKNELTDTKYDRKKANAIAIQLCEFIKIRVRSLGFSRHKIVCFVVIGQNADQDVQMASRSLTMTKFDDWESCNFKNDSLFACATVYGLYYE